jgi:hypothetical protein
MRSTDEICENCHTPENFQAVKLRTDTQYASDEENSFQRVFLALKVGNGEETVAGSGLGAHWHLEHAVRFIATDELYQEIPWVQVENEGEMVTFVDSEADPAVWEDPEATRRTMDCIDCHSRDGHMVRKPADVVDNALANGLIPADLPFVKAQSLAVLEQRYESRDEGAAAITAALRDFYQSEYPEVYAQRQDDVEQTVQQVQRIFQETQFPYMRVFWDTYPDNVGHEDFPGCWRCHDGNHLNEQGEAIPAECNLCHALPQIYGPDETQPIVSLAVDEVPESHRSSLWIAEHRFRFDATCDDCHTISDPGGISNSSFCSNSGCHAQEWTYLKIDAPAVLALAMPEEQPSQPRLSRIPHPLTDGMDCRQCHGLDKVLPYPEDHSEYTQEECTDCHRLSQEVLADLPPSPTPPPPTPFAMTIPSITHTLVGNENCLACHAVNSNIAPAPITHLGFTNDVCLDCHQVAPAFAAVPVATLAPQATPLPSPASVLTATVATEASPTAIEQRATATATLDSTAASAVITATITSTQASQIPHSIQGNENCLACHAVNSNIEPAPPNHTGLANDQCQGCHALPADATPTPGDTA